MAGKITGAAAGLMLAVALGACEGRPLQVVGDPGGAFRSGQGCVAAELEAGGKAGCPSGAQIGFDKLGDDTMAEVRVGNLSAKQISCRRSFCGPGSLGLHAEYAWPAGPAPPSGQKLGEIHYQLPQSTELYGKTVTYALYLDGPETPVNAYLAVIERGGRFRMVDDLPVYMFRKWTQRGGAIRAENDLLHLAPGTTSLVAEAIVVAVYLATDVRTGDREHWSADFYLDEIAW
jgi:hypothetical protein